MTAPSPTAPAHRERLLVPLRWWVQATMLLAMVWLAVVVALPAPVTWSVTAVAAVLVYGGLARWSASTVAVEDGHLVVGRARLPLAVVGEVEPLDREGTRRVAGRDADARAYLALRSWASSSVRVTVEDPADPTPYWLVSSRDPDRLAQAIVRARDHRP